jgi:predicted DNA-binding transcriptional regulator AlpA
MKTTKTILKRVKRTADNLNIEAIEYGRDKVVATVLDCSCMTVWRMAKSGKIPQPIKISPGCSRFDMAAVRAAVKKLQEGAVK